MKKKKDNMPLRGYKKCLIEGLWRAGTIIEHPSVMCANLQVAGMSVSPWS